MKYFCSSPNNRRVNNTNEDERVVVYGGTVVVEFGQRLIRLKPLRFGFLPDGDSF
jgi:hypothetical protein